MAFLHQQGGDEEARHDEEDLDAEEATGDPSQVHVVEQDRRDRDRAQAVQGRLVSELRARARRGGHHRSILTNVDPEWGYPIAAQDPGRRTSGRGNASTRPLARPSGFGGIQSQFA